MTGSPLHSEHKESFIDFGCLLCSQDGTLAYYFSEDDLRQRCEDAGFECSYVKYARVQLVNKKKQKEMRRVFVQGKFLKPQ